MQFGTENRSVFIGNRYEFPVILCTKVIQSLCTISALIVTRKSGRFVDHFGSIMYSSLKLLATDDDDGDAQKLTPSLFNSFLGMRISSWWDTFDTMYLAKMVICFLRKKKRRCYFMQIRRCFVKCLIRFFTTWFYSFSFFSVCIWAGKTSASVFSSTWPFGV